MKPLILTTALAASLALPAKAETQWPRFQGVYLQMTTGELVELPALQGHPLRNHRSFEVEVLDDLPRVNAWEIEAVIFRNQSRLEGDGKLDISMSSLVNQREDPGNHCTRNCRGELVVSNWSFPLEYWHVEYGPGSAWHTPDRVALYPRSEQNPFLSGLTGRTGGNNPQDIQIEAALFEGACCNVSWGYIPLFEGVDE